MSEDNTQLPALDDRTRELIARLVETSVQAALAARPSPQRGNGNDAAARIPSIETDAAPDPNAAQIRAGAGGASEIPARGGSASGDIDRPQEADEDAAEGSGEEDDEDVGADDEDAGGPQAFSPAWYEARRGRRIPPRFDIPARFDPHYPVAFSAESVVYFQTFGAGNASVGRGERPTLSTAARPISRKSPTASLALEKS
jgi:hypothetical protein